MPNYNQPHQFYAGALLHAIVHVLVRLFGAAQSRALSFGGWGVSVIPRCESS